MFDYSLLHWTTFFTAVSLLILVPGPSTLFIMGQSIRHGRKVGVASMVGNWTGVLVHILMAGVGLSAILATSATAFMILKWLGAAYLVWLGVKALRSTGEAYKIPADDVNISSGKSLAWSGFRQGIVVAAFNPKAAIFFLAFIPQFVVDGAGPVWAQSTLHGFLFILNAALIEPFYVLGGTMLVSFLKKNEGVGIWMDRTIGAVFVGLGVRLALIER